MSHNNESTENLWRVLREDPERAAGLLQVQRLIGGLYPAGLPTFFRQPLALTPADLVAGNVDVAMLGAAIDMGTGMRGTGQGPQALRTSDVYGSWGAFAMPHMPTLVNFFKQLTIVDYGDAPNNPLNLEASLAELRAMVAAIARAENAAGKRVIPLIVGGDHSISYANLAGLADVYGKNKIGVVHFDAHYDAGQELFGHEQNHSTWVYQLIAKEVIAPQNFVQVGLRGYYPGRFAFRWMQESGLRYHTMSEIDERGWADVMTDVLAAAKAFDYLFISIDLDVLDPIYAPGVGTPEPGGLTTRELFPLVRRLCAENPVIGADVVELNPIVDPTYLTKLTANRLVCEMLTGLAMYKSGLSEPNYLSPLTSGRH